MNRLLEKYKKEVIPALKEKFGYKNSLAVPRLEKVIINSGIGQMDEKKIQEVIRDIGLITGQKPIVTQARKAIAGFKIRKGMTIGLKVTLRRQRMYEFVDKLISIVLPRVRDFRGLPEKSFDGKGNLSIGLKDQTVFPEIDTGEIANLFGLEIAVVTTAKNDQEGKELLKLLGFPIREK